MEKNDQDKNPVSEPMRHNSNIMIIKNWDRTIESLQKEFNLDLLVEAIGFDIKQLTDLLNKSFPKNSQTHEEFNDKKEKTETVIVETLTVNGKPLDRLHVTVFPPAAKENLTEMTKFKYGGEIILVTEGNAEITYADVIIGDKVFQTNLKTSKVTKNDLIIATP